jgi:hypothetical protein
LTLGLGPGAAGAKSKATLKPAVPAKTEPAAPEKADVTAAADTVRVTIRTVPPRAASVRWGKKSLGPIPAPQALVVVRPRDSGPMDLVISASGFLPVHTRAYTFSDNQVAVKLTPLSKKNTLFGYKEEPPPETESPDPNAPLAPAMGPPLPAPAPAPAPIPVTAPPMGRKP